MILVEGDVSMVWDKVYLIFVDMSGGKGAIETMR